MTLLLNEEIRLSQACFSHHVLQHSCPNFESIIQFKVCKWLKLIESLKCRADVSSKYLFKHQLWQKKIKRYIFCWHIFFILTGIYQCYTPVVAWLFQVSNYRVGKVINLCNSHDNAKITGFKHRLSACNYIPLCCQKNEKEANMLTKPSSIHKISGKSLRGQHTSHGSDSVSWNETLPTDKHKFLLSHKHNMSEMSFGVRPLPHGVRPFLHLTSSHQMSIANTPSPLSKKTLIRQSAVFI